LKKNQERLKKEAWELNIKVRELNIKVNGATCDASKESKKLGYWRTKSYSCTLLQPWKFLPTEIFY
jgi:hypothetical protein